MNKTDLIDHVAAQTDMSKAAAGRAIDALIGGIKDALCDGGSVTLVGFGACRAQSAHRCDHQDRRCQGCEIQTWQSAQGCAKLAGFGACD